tara:strand:- start:476 stop:1066 length:591 start_codon:yes stop_codon:yes gene_type:complete
MEYSMSNNVDVNLTLSEEEFRLLSDLVATAGQFVDGGHFSRSIQSNPDAQEGLDNKLRKAGEKSGIEDVYGSGLYWYQQGFRSKCRSITDTMTELERLGSRNNDEELDYRDLMLHLLAFEQAKRAFFNGFRKDYSEGQDIKDYMEWFQFQDSDMPTIWSRVWLHRYLDEYKQNGIANLKFKLWTRLKMLFWFPPKR